MNYITAIKELVQCDDVEPIISTYNLLEAMLFYNNVIKFLDLFRIYSDNDVKYEIIPSYKSINLFENGNTIFNYIIIKSNKEDLEKIMSLTDQEIFTINNDNEIIQVILN